MEKVRQQRHGPRRPWRWGLTAVAAALLAAGAGSFGASPALAAPGGSHGHSRTESAFASHHGNHATGNRQLSRHARGNAQSPSSAAPDGSGSQGSRQGMASNSKAARNAAKAARKAGKDQSGLAQKVVTNGTSDQSAIGNAKRAAKNGKNSRMENGATTNQLGPNATTANPNAAAANANSAQANAASPNSDTSCAGSAANESKLAESTVKHGAKANKASKAGKATAKSAAKGAKAKAAGKATGSACANAQPHADAISGAVNTATGKITFTVTAGGVATDVVDVKSSGTVLCTITEAGASGDTCVTPVLAPGVYGTFTADITAGTDAGGTDTVSTVSLTVPVLAPSGVTPTAFNGYISATVTPSGQPGVTYFVDATSASGTFGCQVTSGTSCTIPAGGAASPTLAADSYDVYAFAADATDTTNQSGDIDYGSNPIVVHPAAPGAPTGVSAATAGDNAISVTWSPGAGGVGGTTFAVTATATGYPSGSCATPVTSPCTISGLAAGVSYTVSVTGTNAGGTSSAGTTTAVPTGTVMAPTAVPTATAALTASATTAAAGSTITVSGTGYKPLSTVLIELYSSPTELYHATTDASGNFSVAVTLPSGTTGTHTIVATGLDTNGVIRNLNSSVTVPSTTAATSSTGGKTTSVSGRTSGAGAGVSASGLPVTGAPTGRIALFGGLLLLLGMAFMASTNRRVRDLLRRALHKPVA